MEPDSERLAMLPTAGASSDGVDPDGVDPLPRQLTGGHCVVEVISLFVYVQLASSVHWIAEAMEEARVADEQIFDFENAEALLDTARCAPPSPSAHGQ